jgi:cytochrome c biogenesis protein CcmG, thiol:disulfide interchange protein DsbE
VQDLEGQHVVAPWASGHPAMLVFFASWCAPCTKELPVISAYLHRHHLGATRVIGVNYLDDPQRARALAAASHFDFPVLADGGTITQGELALTGLPDTVVVNGRGVVTALTHGVVDARTLAADLATLR